MSQINIEEIEHILQRNHADPKLVQTVMKECKEVVEELKNSRTKVAKTKWEHLIILNDPHGYLDGKEIAGWVVQQKSGADPVLVLDKLLSAKGEQNAQTKRQKSFLGGWLDVFERLKAKFLKAREIKIKTKELTRVLIVKEKLDDTTIS